MVELWENSSNISQEQYQFEDILNMASTIFKEKYVITEYLLLEKV